MRHIIYNNYFISFSNQNFKTTNKKNKQLNNQNRFKHILECEKKNFQNTLFFVLKQAVENSIVELNKRRCRKKKHEICT